MRAGTLPRAAALACALAAACWLGGAGPETGARDCLPEAVWRDIAPGLAFARVAAGCYCRSGSPGIAFLRVDPARARIEPYHESEFPREASATVDGWMRRLEAPVVLNAGLYDEARRHLGVLRRDGTERGLGFHASWKGLLVSGRFGSCPPAMLLDLLRPADGARAREFPHAVQSMLLFDRRGQIRIRQSEQIAPRSGVAEDGRGRLYFFATEGSFTLWDTGVLLRDAGWELELAMALDGGNEAQLAVESEAIRYRSYGVYDGAPGTGHGGATSGAFRTSGVDSFRESTTLPAVLAIWPRPADP